jgi:hypothetical protein
MRVREHQGFGHGLAPGTDHDMNCTSCQSERAAGTPPVITGQDGPGKRRQCFYIAVEQFDEEGYIPSLVTEGEPDHVPYMGNGRCAAPWHWGRTYDEARATAARENERMGISPAEAAEIVLSSMRMTWVPNPPARKFPAMVKVEIANAHGTFATDTLALDLMIKSRLPASRNDLCRHLAETTGLPESNYDDVSTVTEFLIMMADADYPWKGIS